MGFDGAETRVLGLALLVVSMPPDADAQTSRPAARPVVQLGVDVLKQDGFAQLQNQRVGLITNHTGRSGDGRSTLEVLRHGKISVVALFGPEHGLAGTREGNIEDAQHKSGLKIHSLHGKTKKPTEAMLEGVDTLVFDIQDIGCRFYTYISTMGLAMEAAAEHGKRFVVLDRPNPIGGVVRGPMPDAGREDFVCYHAIPVCHGMTVGELASLFVRDRKDLRKLDLLVVKMKGWRRTMAWEDTGLEWVNPSPNMRSPMQALVYPGVGLWEFTNISVGRGTDTPFRRVGAPWLKHRELARALNKLAGVSCVAVRFTPTASVYKGKECRGVLLTVTDRREFDPIGLGFELAVQLRRLHPRVWDTTKLDRLLKNKKMAAWILGGGKTVAPHWRDSAPRVKLYER